MRHKPSGINIELGYGQIISCFLFRGEGHVCYRHAGSFVTFLRRAADMIERDTKKRARVLK